MSKFRNVYPLTSFVCEVKVYTLRRQTEVHLEGILGRGWGKGLPVMLLLLAMTELLLLRPGVSVSAAGRGGQ